MSLAAGGGFGGGYGAAGGGASYGATMGAAAAMAGAAMAAGRGNEVRQRRRQAAGDPEQEKAREDARAAHQRRQLWTAAMWIGFVIAVSVAVIQIYVGAQDGMFEFLGIDASREEYKRRIIEFYREYNPEKLEGDMHNRPVDNILWKYRYKEKKLLAKLRKKYTSDEKRAASEASDAGEAAANQDAEGAKGASDSDPSQEPEGNNGGT